MSSPPTVSVIIPAYNRAGYIATAVASILDQTLRDLELIVVDDGSTDATAEAVAAFGDPRIRLVRHPRNLGIPQARNTGLRCARGRYLAWLDSDDLARPDRLERQVRFLDAHPAVALVGCCAGKLGPDGSPLRGVRIPPLSPADARAWLLFRSAFQQSSITGRTAILARHPYREDFGVCEDLDLFIRLAREYPLLNLPCVLIDRRIHPDQTIRLQQAAIRERSMRLFGASLEELGMEFTGEDLRRHVLLGNPKHWRFTPDAGFLDWTEDWLRRLREANAGSGRLDRSALAFATGFFWMLACHAARPALGHAGAARRFFGSALMPALASSRARTWLRAAFRVWWSEPRPDAGA